MADYYTTGQVTLTNGSASIVGVGTAWAIANIAGGTIFAEAAGNPLPLETIADDTHATAAIKWTGPTGTYEYALLRATAFSEQLETNSNIMSRLLVGMEAGTIYRYDESGDLAEKATYDARPEDFGFLAIDVNPAQLFIKASDASGDWAGPFSYGTGPQGDQGPVGPAAVLIWRGAYSGATTYAKNDGVRGSGRSFISLQDANTGHALPVFPATSNAWWDLTAEKGADGMGTGDVVGPAGTTDDTPAFFDTATGKLLKSKTLAAFKTWLATTALDVSFDNSVASLLGAPATVQAALNTLAAAGKNIALLSLEVADLKGQRMGMVGGVADSFDDQTGILAGDSSSYAYDAANDWFSPAQPATLQASGTGSNTASGGEFTLIDRTMAIAIGTQIRSVGIYSTTAYSAIFKIVRRVSSTVYDILASYSFAHPGGGWYDYVLPALFAVPASGTIYAGATQPASTNLNIYASGSRAYKALDQAVGNGVTGFTEDTGNSLPTRVIYAATNMILASVAYATGAVPSTMRVALQLADALTLTPGTDFIVEVSRNNGATWIAVTMALTSSFLGVKMYEGTVAMSGATGTNARWRLRTLNYLGIIASGVVLQYS